MLRLFGLLFISVSATSDDHSLMQEGSIALSKSSAAEVQNAMRKLGDVMQDMPPQPKTRQMAIDALMKQVSQATKLDADTIAVLQQIRDLFAIIFTNLIAAKNADQHTLDGFVTTLEDCNSHNVETDNNAATQWGVSRGEHASCRADENAAWLVVKNGACADLYALFELINPDDTNSPNLACGHHPGEGHDVSAAWALWFDSAETELEQFQVEFDNHHDTCMANYGSLDAMVADCDAKQNSFESDYCIWKSVREGRCSTLVTCFANATADYDSTWATLHAAGTVRVNEATVVHHIDCLIENMMAEELDPTLCYPTDAQKAAYEETYNVMGILLPNQSDCDTSMFEGLDYPGQEKWTSCTAGTSASEYDTLCAYALGQGRFRDNTGAGDSC